MGGAAMLAADGLGLEFWEVLMAVRLRVRPIEDERVEKVVKSLVIIITIN